MSATIISIAAEAAVNEEAAAASSQVFSVGEAMGLFKSPLIAPDQYWLVIAVIVAGVALSIYLEQTYRWAARVSGPLLALLIAITLANTGIMPRESPVYDVIYGQVVPLAIPLLLFRANVFRMFRASATQLVAFHIAAVGTLLGAPLALIIMRGIGWDMPNLPHAIAVMTGSYIGGGVNFVAVANTYQVSSDVTAPLMVADNFVMASAFAILLLISVSRFFLSRYPHPHTEAVDPEAARNLAAEFWKRKDVGLLDIAKALAIAFAVTGGAMTLSRFLTAPTPGVQQSASQIMVLKLLFNPYVLITFTMLFIATVFHRSMGRIQGADEIGTYLLYTFLFVIGLPADLYYVLTQTPAMFVMCGIIALTNIIVTFSVGRLLRLNLEDLVIAVNISLGGPPTGAAFAISKGWSNLILPALLLGIWGYVIGTPLGIIIGQLLGG